MWRVFGTILVIALVAAGAAWLASNAGSISVVFLGWRIETNFALVAVLLILLLWFLNWLYRIILRTFGGPAALLTYHRTRRQRLGQDALRQGLVAVAAGNPTEVRKLAARANSLLNDPPLTLLLSAQAAQLEGDDKRAMKAYRKMLDNPETEFLGLRGLFMSAVRKGERNEALGFAERAFELQPETPWVSAALFELQSSVGEWAGAAKTLEQAVKTGHMAADVAQRKRAVLYTEQALAARAKGEMTEAETWGLKAADLSPGLTPAAVLAARHHIREGNLWKAAETLEKAWSVAPHPDLAETYKDARKSTIEPGAVAGEADLKREEKAAARWLKGLADFNKDHLESRLLRAAQEIRLGRRRAARKALKGLTEGYATVRVCQLMAEIEAAEPGDSEEAARAAKRWLTKAVSAPRDAHWMCETCGREAKAWHSTCGNCGAFDSLSWKAPEDLVAELNLAPVEIEADESEDEANEKKTPAETPKGEGVSAALPVIIDGIAEPVDEEAPAPDKKKKPEKEAMPASSSEPAQPSKEAKAPDADKGATKPADKTITSSPDKNPLSGETIKPGAEETALPRPVDDPGPDAADPFSDDDDSSRW